MKSVNLGRRQDGVALAIVLVLLVVMTLLGLAAMRGTLMQERMSASEYDRSLSFQAAEAALREGESVAAGKPIPTGAGCNNGICAAPVAGATPRWLDTDANWTANSRAVALSSLGSLTANPRFIIEIMSDNAHGSSCTTSGDVSPDATCTDVENRYRVTARSSQAGRSDVVLQTIYAAP